MFFPLLCKESIMPTHFYLFPDFFFHPNTPLHIGYVLDKKGKREERAISFPHSYTILLFF